MYILCIFLSRAELTRWIIDLDSALDRSDALLYRKKIIIRFHFEKVENSLVFMGRNWGRAFSGETVLELIFEILQSSFYSNSIQFSLRKLFKNWIFQFLSWLTLSETNLLSIATILFLQLSPEYILQSSVPKYPKAPTITIFFFIVIFYQIIYNFTSSIIIII